MIGISDLIRDASSESWVRQPLIHRKWIHIAVVFQDLIPDSTSIALMRHLGNLDMLIRCLEDEYSPDQVKMILGVTDPLPAYVSLLSEMWVCKAYELCGILIQRKKKDKKSAPVKSSFIELYRYLELLRLSFNQHELSFADPRLKGPDGQDEAEITKMPENISERGAMMWCPTERTGRIPEKSYWLERRDLSDRFLNIFNNHTIEDIFSEVITKKRKQ